MIKVSPKSYSVIGTFIDLVPEKERTVDYLKSRINEQSMNLREEEKTSVSTFYAKNSNKVNGVCFKCNKPGHYKKDCTYGNNDQQGRGAY